MQFEQDVARYGAVPRFKNEQEAQAAFNKGTIEKGRRIIINNQVGIWE